MDAFHVWETAFTICFAVVVVQPMTKEIENQSSKEDLLNGLIEEVMDQLRIYPMTYTN